ncbi:MAG: alpha/beta hydrolase [Candidatus Lokiarchaeota archaeon]|nr:alpha/beta hydrolase [Candidatus Lokiarchaeota archaeon]
MPFANLPHMKMYYEIIGNLNSKFTLLMIHGWTESHKYWVEQSEFFAKWFKIVSIDLKGHGKSSKNRSGYSIRKLSRDVYELKRLLNLDNIILVGHSLGGMVVLDYYFRRNFGEIKGLILFNTTSTPFKMIPRNVSELQGLGKFGVRKMLMGIYDISPDIVLNLSERKKQNVDELIEEANAMLPFVTVRLGIGSSTFNVNRKLRVIRAPTLLITGELDMVTPIRIMKSMHEKIPNSEFHIIKNSGHMVAIEKCEEVNEIIFQFLKKHDFV